MLLAASDLQLLILRPALSLKVAHMLKMLLGIFVHHELRGPNGAYRAVFIARRWCQLCTRLLAPPLL